MALGTCALLAAGLAIGLAPQRALLHGLWVFMGGWSTGGFAPMAANVLYYHSALYEMIAIGICIVGSFNFALHWAVWTGNRAELRRNVELVSFAVTMTLALLLVAAGLARLGVYPDATALFRKVFFQVASGHTTTGFGTIYARTFVAQWGPLAMLGVTLAMAIGASACSTAGGIKGLRVGVLVAALLQEARRLISPERAVVAQRFHHLGQRHLTDAAVRSAALVALWYVTTYAIGTVAGVWYGADIASALFEAVSAGSNTGLSCGLTAPTLPAGLKIVYILEMWVGRLEFMGVIALFGFIAALARGK
jgi:trk system potassium uptake protein TrkH